VYTTKLEPPQIYRFGKHEVHTLKNCFIVGQLDREYAYTIL